MFFKVNLLVLIEFKNLLNLVLKVFFFKSFNNLSFFLRLYWVIIFLSLGNFSDDNECILIFF